MIETVFGSLILISIDFLRDVEMVVREVCRVGQKISYGLNFFN